MTYGDYSGVTECIVLCPSRENAAGALEMVRSAYKTMQRIGTEIIIVIDEDEPQVDAYLEIANVKDRPYGSEPPRIMVVEGGSLTKATNEAVERIWDVDAIVGHVGDDHRFITPGWDNRIRSVLLETPGVAYAYDGFRSAWASAWWTNTLIIRTLGWLALPGSMHLTIDDAFMDIGAGLGRLFFLDDLLIEHLHPAGGKVEWRAIVKSHYARDRRAKEDANLRRYRELYFAEDIAKLQLALGMEQTAITDMQPGFTFRRNLKGKWALPEASTVALAKVWPTNEELEEWAGRKIKSGNDWLTTRIAWRRAHGS